MNDIPVILIIIKFNILLQAQNAIAIFLLPFEIPLNPEFPLVLVLFLFLFQLYPIIK